MSGGAKRKAVPAKLDLTEEQKSDIKEAFRSVSICGDSVFHPTSCPQPVRHSEPGRDRLQGPEGGDAGARIRAEEGGDQEDGL